MDKSMFKGNKLIVPKHTPGRPPKNYGEKKAIGVFACLAFSFGLRCPELLRARITTRRDVYIMPFVEYQPFKGKNLQDFHLSYHASGEFHWTSNGNHIEPAFGEDDFRKAFEVWLQVRSPLCLCLRKGKGLNEEEIVSSAKCLSRYIPMPIDIEAASQELKHAGFYRLVSADLKSEIDKETRRTRLLRLFAKPLRFLGFGKSATCEGEHVQNL